MILELAILNIKENLPNQFELDFKKAAKYISAIDEYIGHQLQKNMEDENKYILLVQWEKLEDHTLGFRASKEYVEWKNLLQYYYDPFPIVVHFEKVYENEKET